MRLIYEKLKPGAFAPTKAFPLDAGWDIKALEAQVLMPGQRAIISTGLAIKLQPSGPQEAFALYNGLSWYWRAADKSGLASTLGVHILGGVVDRNYRGEVGIIAMNLGFAVDGRTVFAPWTIKPGDKIAQIIPNIIWDCQDADEGPVGTSDRGAGGFGSTH